MNYSIIFKMVSLLMAVLGTAFSLCAIVAAAHSDNAADAESLPSWICILSLTFMIALSLYLPTKNAPRRIFRKEALCVVGVGWILAAFVGALPYIFIRQCGLADALFESASGITTTGASVFGDVESMIISTSPSYFSRSSAGRMEVRLVPVSRMMSSSMMRLPGNMDFPTI